MNAIPENTDLLQQLMDNIEDNIFFKDSNSRFIMINKANAKWFGLNDPQEAIGKDDSDFFGDTIARKSIEDEQRIMRSGKPMLGEEQTSNLSGEPDWGSVTKIPLRDNNGQIIGTMGIGRNIDELKKKELQLEQANEQIAEDLRMAAQLQQTFLPQAYPSFTNTAGRERILFHHYYEADIELGGDFCSIYKLNETKAALLICDVMGHGVRAALVTGIIHTIAEELTKKTESPGEFLTLMNRQLLPALQTNGQYLFATAAYLTIDTATGELAGALAGHPLPFLIQPKRHQVSQLKEMESVLGPALAIAEGYTYQSASTRLHTGDEVLLYTDGICEAMNAGRDEFGEQHLQETILDYNTLPLKELVPRIINVVKDYAGSNKVGDDICLLGFTLN